MFAVEYLEGIPLLKIDRVLVVSTARAQRISVAMAAGTHPFPFRTRQLSPPAPMVLGLRNPGRVGRRRINLKQLAGPSGPASSRYSALRFPPPSRGVRPHVTVFGGGGGHGLGGDT